MNVEIISPMFSLCNRFTQKQTASKLECGRVGGGQDWNYEDQGLPETYLPCIDIFYTQGEFASIPFAFNF